MFVTICDLMLFLKCFTFHYYKKKTHLEWYQWNLQGKIITKAILQLHLFSRVVFPSLLFKKSKPGFIKKNDTSILLHLSS